MWIFNSNTQRVELVLNQDHITRLLGEGCTEVEDPRVQPVVEAMHEPVEETQPEEAHEQASKITDIGKKRRRKAAR